MEIKVREVSEVESKSTQQVEQELLEKHEAEQQADEQPVAEEATAEEPADEPGLSEDDVRSFLSERYGREITSLDELNEARETAPELPEDVAAYYKYKQETGRGLEDFIKVNRNLDEADGDSLLKEYLLITEDGLDAEDVEMMMDDYTYMMKTSMTRPTSRRPSWPKRKRLLRRRNTSKSRRRSIRPLLSQGVPGLWKTPRSTKRTSNTLSRRRRTKRNRSAGKSGLTRRRMRSSPMDSKVLSSVSTTNPTCTLPVTALN